MAFDGSGEEMRLAWRHGACLGCGCYGPREATVVASAARFTVTGQVRIGLPLGGWATGSMT